MKASSLPSEIAEPPPRVEDSGASVVSVRSVSKTYRVYDRPWHRLFEAVTGRRRHRPFHSLHDVSVELRRGESLGIIGENGAGKSTFLKILAGVTSPSSGTVAVNGKVASILELGSGFHPEFTGRQNIHLNAAMLGLTRAEVEVKMPDIIEFSELGHFIDQPVKAYSTGMSMRLGFSIATQVEPDVLIIDEALSVGDGYFQKKCIDRLKVFLDNGGTLLFCSHAMYYVSSFCQRAIWLRNGKAEAIGPTSDVVRRYESFLVRKTEAAAAGQDALPFASREDDHRASPGRWTRVELHGGQRREDGRAIAFDEPLDIDLEWESDDPQRRFHVAVGIDRVDGVQVAVCSTFHDDWEPIQGKREYSLRLNLPRLSLLKGEFSIYAFLLDERALHVYDAKIIEGAFHAHSTRFEAGLMRIEHQWLGAEPARLVAPDEVAAV
ncbi:MAG: ABC transporter ATP-binding protein [Acidobacteriota bacterium]